MPKPQNFIVKNLFFFVGNMLELSCLEVYLQQNFSYSFFSINASFVTFLQPIKETQTITGIFLNHSNFQNFTRICQDITSEIDTICNSIFNYVFAFCLHLPLNCKFHEDTYFFVCLFTSLYLTHIPVPVHNRYVIDIW